MNQIKKFFFFPLWLYLLFCVGCTAGEESSPLNASSGPAAFSAPASSFASEPENSAEASAPMEAVTYYFDEAHGESLLAKITEEGTLLPDGRLITSEGVVTPDGKVLYAEQAPFPYVQEDRTVPETVQTLPDGTRIVATTYYFNNDLCDCPVAKMVKGEDPILTTGTFYDILLPDGRRITGRGVLLPDGATVYQPYAPFYFNYVNYPEPEAAMTLPDGTRIIAKEYYYGGPYEEESVLIHRSEKDENALQLPDGRIAGKNGVFLPDGTKQYSFEEIIPPHFEAPNGYLVMMMFPDGTRLINPYGGETAAASPGP